ncbi:protein AF-9-like [Centroberyx affinis]|uniref:protein AF-9-like n=1 Tax=Centroberyx affinis TaxID=166261 RepID=UPI003A5C4852
MRREEPSQDNIYSEATVCSPLTESSAPELEAYQSHQSPAVSPCEDKLKAAAESQTSASPPRQAEQQHEEQSEDGYEVMNSIGPRGGEASSSESPVLVLKEPNTPALGGTVNLILSFGNTGDSQVQVLEPPARMEEVEEEPEPVHRVSTYLHVKDNNMALTPVYESITLPRQKTRSAASASSSLSPSSSSSSPSSSGPTPQTTSVSFHPLTRSGSSSIFSSVKRMGKKRKRKRDARRHTIQKIMGVEEQTDEAPIYACEAITYDTQTWPLKEGRRKKSSPKSSASGDGVEPMAYMKNPLLKDIDTECSGEYSITPYAVSEGSSALPSTSQVRSHCRFLSLGSVLSFELPKDMSLIPSIQDIITIGPPESKKGAVTHPDPRSERHTALSSFKQTRSPPAAAVSSTTGYPETQTVVVKDLPDMDKKLQPPPPPALDEDEDQTVPCNDLSKTQFGCSGTISLHEDAEQEWDQMSSELNTSISGREGTSQPSQVPLCVNQAHSPMCVKRVLDFSGPRV